MREVFLLPDIGEGLIEAEVVAWLVQPGESVAVDQPVIEVLTDKSAVELPSPHAGVLAGHPHAPGDVVGVGSELFTIETSEPTEVVTAVPVEPAVEASPARPLAPKAAPATRRRARELGIDLTTIAGTGPGGRILETDLVAPPDAATSVDPQHEPPGVAAPLRGVRRAISRSMTQAWSEIPHIHVFDDVDATALVELRRSLRSAHADRADHLTATAFFIAATAQALRDHPQLNASVGADAETVTQHAEINIGFATATERGVVVPVIHRADQLRLLDIADAVRDLAAAARADTLESAAQRNGTFTVTNFGSFGGHQATPIIRAPEAGIVGFGRIGDQPVARDGAVVVRPILPVVLGADHRLVDGDVAVGFLRRIVGALTDPVALLAGI